MPKRLTFEYVYEYIKEKGYTLLSTTYNTSKDNLELKCKVCEKVYTQRFDRFQQGYYHPFCKSDLPQIWENTINSLLNKSLNYLC